MILETTLILSIAIPVISAVGYAGILVLGKVDDWEKRHHHKLISHP